VPELAAEDDELALGDGRGARLGEDRGAEDEGPGRAEEPGAEVPADCPGAEVPGDSLDEKVPSNSSSAKVAGACPGVEVPGDGSGAAVVTPRHPVASRATSTSTAIFGDVIAGQAIAS